MRLKIGSIVKIRPENLCFVTTEPYKKWIRNGINLVVIQLEPCIMVQVARPRFNNVTRTKSSHKLKVPETWLEASRFRKMGPRPGNRRGGWDSPTDDLSRSDKDVR